MPTTKFSDHRRKRPRRAAWPQRGFTPVGRNCLCPHVSRSESHNLGKPYCGGLGKLRFIRTVGLSSRAAAQQHTDTQQWVINHKEIGCNSSLNSLNARTARTKNRAPSSGTMMSIFPVSRNTLISRLVAMLRNISSTDCSSTAGPSIWYDAPLTTKVGGDPTSNLTRSPLSERSSLSKSGME
jgi:hypothetical protein